MKNDRKPPKGTLCPCGSLNFEIIDCENEKNIETWKCVQCGNQFEIEWKE